MEYYNLIERNIYAEIPPKVEYSLTELGRDLEPILNAMLYFGKKYKCQKQIPAKHFNS
jgi:DNA-binding HxlR family transcriptional regulator